MISIPMSATILVVTIPLTRSITFPLSFVVSCSRSVRFLTLSAGRRIIVRISFSHPLLLPFHKFSKRGSSCLVIIVHSLELGKILDDRNNLKMMRGTSIAAYNKSAPPHKERQHQTCAPCVLVRVVDRLASFAFVSRPFSFGEPLVRGTIQVNISTKRHLLICILA
jgi:hypothetical protein